MPLALKHVTPQQARSDRVGDSSAVPPSPCCRRAEDEVAFGLPWAGGPPRGRERALCKPPARAPARPLTSREADGSFQNLPHTLCFVIVPGFLIFFCSFCNCCLIMWANPAGPWLPPVSWLSWPPELEGTPASPPPWGSHPAWGALILPAPGQSGPELLLPSSLLWGCRRKSCPSAHARGVMREGVWRRSWQCVPAVLSHSASHSWVSCRLS